MAQRVGARGGLQQVDTLGEGLDELAEAVVVRDEPRVALGHGGGESERLLEMRAKLRLRCDQREER